jgi:hypothetical protein
MREERLEVSVSFDERHGSDGLAERVRHRRRAQAQLSRIAQLDQRTALADQCLHAAEADVRPPIPGASLALWRGSGRRKLRSMS